MFVMSFPTTHKNLSYYNFVGRLSKVCEYNNILVCIRLMKCFIISGVRAFLAGISRIVSESPKIATLVANIYMFLELGFNVSS